MLKVCTTVENLSNEVNVSGLVRSIDVENPGKARLRVTLDSSQIQRSYGSHQCLGFALGLTYTKLWTLFPKNALNKDLLQQNMLSILLSLGFLHQAGIVDIGTTVSFNSELAEIDMFSRYHQITFSRSGRPQYFLNDRTKQNAESITAQGPRRPHNLSIVHNADHAWRPRLHRLWCSVSSGSRPETHQ